MAFGQNVFEHSLIITGALTTSSIAVWPVNNRYRILQAISAVGTAVATDQMTVDVRVARSAAPTSFSTIYTTVASQGPFIASGATISAASPPTSAVTDLQPGDIVKLVLSSPSSFTAATDLNVSLLLQPA